MIAQGISHVDPRIRQWGCLTYSDGKRQRQYSCPAVRVEECGEEVQAPQASRATQAGDVPGPGVNADEGLAGIGTAAAVTEAVVTVDQGRGERIMQESGCNHSLTYLSIVYVP